MPTPDDPPAASERASRAYSLVRRPPRSAGEQLRQQLAANVIDDGALGAVRGGFDAGNGLQLSFSFQQQTFVNSELVQTIVVPTVTLTKNLTSAVIGSAPAFSSTGPATAAAASPTISLNGSPVAQLGITRSPSGAAAQGSSTIATNGGQAGALPAGVQSQLNRGLQPYIASGVATVINNGATSIMSVVGAGGLTNVINNVANNQMIQQAARLNVDLSGLSQLVQQGAATSVAGRLTSNGALFR